MTLWYLARAAGYIALLCATASVVLGALASSRRTADDRGRDQRVLHQLAHRSAAVVTLAMLALHVVLLVTDQYVDLTLGGVLVPFTAGYRAFALGLGTLAAYALVVIAATGALRGRLARSRRGALAWRGVHLTAYAIWPLSMAHGLLAGTDTGTWWSWTMYAGSGLAVVLAVWARLGAADRHSLSPLHQARQSRQARRTVVHGGLR